MITWSYCVENQKKRACDRLIELCQQGYPPPQAIRIVIQEFDLKLSPEKQAENDYYRKRMIERHNREMGL